MEIKPVMSMFLTVEELNDALIRWYGKKNTIPQVEVEVGCDEFENMIRKMGVEFACEWFGHDADSDFTKDTIITLCERSGVKL